MSEWGIIPIEVIADIYNHRRVPLSKVERERKQGSYPYYGASGVIDFVDDFLFDGDFVLVSEDGENLKTRKTPIAFEAKGQFWVNNHAHILKGKKSFHNDLLVYAFANLDLTPYLTGAVQPKLNKANLLSIELVLPFDEQEQEAIVEVLSSLDDKIDLLKRQNKTLEGMAEALFRQWFIEEAQDDWEEVSIDQVGIFLNGLACQKHRPTTYGSLPVLKIRDLRNGLTEDSDRACANVDPKYIVEAGDLIFSWSGTLEVKIWDGERCVLNQHLFKVTSEDFPRWYLLLWCQHHLAQWRATAEAHATTMGHIKRGDLKAAMVLVPSDYELSKMDEKMGGIMARIDLNNSEMKSLVKQRDTLLPKLMSGEVRVQMD